jgi:hypothetical protein
MITFLYILWIAYTVGTLSVFLFLITFGIWAKISNEKQAKKIREMMTEGHPEYREEGW